MSDVEMSAFAIVAMNLSIAAIKILHSKGLLSDGEFRDMCDRTLMLLETSQPNDEATQQARRIVEALQKS